MKYALVLFAAALYGQDAAHVFTIIPSSARSTVGEIRFRDKQATPHYVGFKAADTISADLTWKLPAADAAGLFQSDGAGNVTISYSTQTITPFVDRTYDVGSSSLAYTNSFTQNVFGEVIKIAKAGTTFGTTWSLTPDAVGNALGLYDTGGTLVLLMQATTLPRTFYTESNYYPYTRDTYDIGGAFPNEWRSAYFSRKVDATQGFTVGGVSAIDSSRNGSFVNMNISGTCTGCGGGSGVTSIATTSPIGGGTITTTGTITCSTCVTTNTSQTLSGSKTLSTALLASSTSIDIGTSAAPFGSTFSTSAFGEQIKIAKSGTSFGTTWSLKADAVGTALGLYDTGGTLVMLMQATTLPRTFYTESNYYPYTGATYDIGGAFPNQWKDAYFSGTVDSTSFSIGGTSVIDASRNGYFVSGDFTGGVSISNSNLTIDRSGNTRVSLTNGGAFGAGGIFTYDNAGSTNQNGMDGTNGVYSNVGFKANGVAGITSGTCHHWTFGICDTP